LCSSDVSFMHCDCFFFFSSRRRHTRSKRDWSSDVCSSDLGSIGMIAFVNNPCIQRNDISFSYDSVPVRNSMYDFLIDRYTDRSRISIITEEGGSASVTSDDLLPQMINISG